jgi:hypothetical protein
MTTKTMTIDVTPEQYWQLKRLVRDITKLENTGIWRGHRIDPFSMLMCPGSFEDDLFQRATEAIMGFRLDLLTEYTLHIVRG